MQTLAHPRGPAERRGSSLVELLVAVGVTAVVLGSVSLAAGRAQQLMNANEASLRLDTRQSRAALKAMRLLLAAGTGSVTPDLTPPGGGAPTPWAPQVQFRTCVDFQANAIVWGDLQSIGWERDVGELDNGVDDDGDGLVDEGALVWFEREGEADERRVVLASGVAELLEGEDFNGLDDNGNGLVDEAGACVDVDENGVLTLRFTLEDAPRGDLVQRTRTVRLRLRN